MSRPPSGIVEGRLSRVVLDGEVPSSLPPALEADRAQAVAELASAGNEFVPLTVKSGTPAHGPFVLHLAVQQGRLVFDIRRGNGTHVTAIPLADQGLSVAGGQPHQGGGRRPRRTHPGDRHGTAWTA